jgi:hypothetical protein
VSSRDLRLAATGFVGGLLIGVAYWSRELHARRRDLFSPRPLRRLAALSHMRGRRDPATARLLHEFIRWEKRTSLRRRARRLLADMEAQLD